MTLIGLLSLLLSFCYQCNAVASCPAASSPAVSVSPSPTAARSDLTPTPITPSRGGSNGSFNTVAYVDPAIWSSADPTAYCEPPCTLVLPPWNLSTLTTIEIAPVTETTKTTWSQSTDGQIVYVTLTTVAVIVLPPVTTSIIDVSNVVKM
ncbi:hypothetical protein F5884DRAFT_862552 [Xylogone sp. PMI_703]|nr:hypothetical protein F5884DRAFT_862552 [Xylogone sp. PMI_703]